MKQYNLIQYCWTLMLLLSACQIINAQELKKIIPIQSTCQDVERILGGEHCGKEEEVIVLPSERTRIVYSTKICQEFFGQYWNVPIGTVVIVEKHFTIPITLDDLGIKFNKSEYIKNDYDYLFEVVYYKKTGELSFNLIEGNYVNKITYYPSNADKKLKRCNQPEKKSKGISTNMTCQDIEQLFGGKRCGKESDIIDFPGRTIEITYSTKKCQTFYGKHWDIPVGTIVSFKQIFNESKSLEELAVTLNMNIDESEYTITPTNTKGEVIYKKKTGEIIFKAKNGFVSEINSYPSKTDAETKVCKKSDLSKKN